MQCLETLRRPGSKAIVVGSLVAAAAAFAVPSAGAASTGSTPAASATVGLKAAVPAPPATGGVTFSDPPVIQQIMCRTLCSARTSKARAAHTIVVKETGRLAIHGRKVSDTTWVLFMGVAGDDSDDIRIAPAHVAKASLTVVVPSNATSGEVELVDADGDVSEASSQTISIIHPIRSSGGVTVGEKAPAVTRKPTTEVLRWPVSGPITSPFGPRWGRIHTGIDIGVPAGTPIHAAAAGTVIMASSQGGYGNFTCVKHITLITCYAHQSQFGTSVGAYVNKGQVIGLSGCTGNCYGDHLHFEVRIGDIKDGVYAATPVNPIPYLPARSSSSSARYGPPLDYDLPVTGLVNAG